MSHPADSPALTTEHVDPYLEMGTSSGASDVHLGAKCQPTWRRFGVLEPIWKEAPFLTAQDTERMTQNLLTEEQAKKLATTGDVDFAYSTSFGRFRGSVVRQRHGYELVFRIINAVVRTMEELGLPEHLKQLTQYHNGLILVTGAVGSGKSTTLAAFIEQVNRTRKDHIITLEDPIEFIYEPKGCQITQREVHLHTESFSAALRGCLRQDPDVLLVGEMRDLETISLAVTASETGHLVLGTLHTSSAARTLDRVLDVFPLDQRDQIRIMVSESLRGIVTQQLIPRADGKGRVMAMEVLTNSPAVANCIREGKTFMLPGVMQTGKKLGMKLMDESLMDLYDKGMISEVEAEARAEDKLRMRQHLKR
ncbi:MAG TPA: type IV pilus twitching motility protein PilT [Chthoniobacterales bacterium]